jgi:hypothetical protein
MHVKVTVRLFLCGQPYNVLSNRPVYRIAAALSKPEMREMRSHTIFRQQNLKEATAWETLACVGERRQNVF